MTRNRYREQQTVLVVPEIFGRVASLGNVLDQKNKKKRQAEYEKVIQYYFLNLNWTTSLKKNQIYFTQQWCQQSKSCLILFIFCPFFSQYLKHVEINLKIILKMVGSSFGQSSTGKWLIRICSGGGLERRFWQAQSSPQQNTVVII